MTRNDSFCKEDIALPQIRCEILQGLILITLTPGYFWYLSLTPDRPGQVNVLDAVNVEDKACTEKVYRGLLASMAEPGPLSHLERPNFEFAQYLASRIPA